MIRIKFVSFFLDLKGKDEGWTMSTSNFSYSEEAFLLNSLNEMVKIWASGNGKADINLKIENGSSELQLVFKLGHHSVGLPQHNNFRQPQYDLHHE